MPATKTAKRRGSGGSPGLEAPQKLPRITENYQASDSLEQLSTISTIVADTADFEGIKEFNATDATTNPTLVLQAVNNPKYKHILEKAVKEAQAAAEGKEKELVIEDAVDRVLVGFGTELLQIIPGLVSTEIGADLSFDEGASVERARKVVELYAAKGISKDQILIKIAATWEGIQAAKQLQQEGINCNITLLFTLCQAVAAAEAGAYLISPFVGRILDWHKKHSPDEDFSGAKDPGVKSVSQIYKYFKHFGFKTIVMAASFRNTDEIMHLAGCDKLTIAPKLLQELQNSHNEVHSYLCAEDAKSQEVTRVIMDEKVFRWMLNEDAMATEKLSEGIRNFASDLNKLKALIKEYL